MAAIVVGSVVRELLLVSAEMRKLNQAELAERIDRQIRALEAEREKAERIERQIAAVAAEIEAVELETEPDDGAEGVVLEAEPEGASR